MSALAAILVQKGMQVSGSDRSYDQGKNTQKFEKLQNMGVKICPQDGTGLSSTINALVVSSAVEDSIPDVKAAKEQDIPICKRAELLASLFNKEQGIGVAGTSGKTTVTGMIAHILTETGRDPTVMNGGIMPNFMQDPGSLGNARVGRSPFFVSEMDESDGSIALFTPSIAVLNNITRDHKPLDELRLLFSNFLNRAQKGAIINLDDPEAAKMAAIHSQTLTYSLSEKQADLLAQDIKPGPAGIEFRICHKQSAEQGPVISLTVPGRHNVANALAAIGAALLCDVTLKDAANALSSFKGIRRRLDVLGTENGITIIDDFAHNPDKIAASLQTLREFPGRLWIIFQPHGFGPMKMMRNEIVKSFTTHMQQNDTVLMPEIFYAGGTTEKTISSNDLIKDIQDAGHQARFYNKREETIPVLQAEAEPGDRIVIMGARDDTLTDFARAIQSALQKQKNTA